MMGKVIAQPCPHIGKIENRCSLSSKQNNQNQNTKLCCTWHDFPQRAQSKVSGDYSIFKCSVLKRVISRGLRNQGDAGKVCERVKKLRQQNKELDQHLHGYSLKKLEYLDNSLLRIYSWEAGGGWVEFTSHVAHSSPHNVPDRNLHMNSILSGSPGVLSNIVHCTSRGLLPIFFLDHARLLYSSNALTLFFISSLYHPQIAMMLKSGIYVQD